MKKLILALLICTLGTTALGKENIKELFQNREYEKVLEVLNPTEVSDPATYFFYKGVAEYSLIMKKEATHSLRQLLISNFEVPERYQVLAELMLEDMLTWQDKDLKWIARKMQNSGRRLNLAQAGPITQRIQKDIVNRLDELIKKLENKAKGSANSNKETCPNGKKEKEEKEEGKTGTPMKDSNISKTSGPGLVKYKTYKKIVDRWETLPERERKSYIQEITKGMSDKHKQAIYNYFKRLSETKKKKKN